MQFNMVLKTVTETGDHFGMGDAYLDMADWKTGAIMAPCREVRLCHDPVRGKYWCEFICEDEEASLTLGLIVANLMKSGPVNVGLTDERGSLRFVAYFPNEKVAARRMKAATASLGGECVSDINDHN